MAKYIIPHRVFMERLVSKIPGSKLDAGDGLIIPADNPYPIDYVAMFCMPILIEKYYGRYIDDVDNPQRCIYYWNKMMADSNAEASFKPRTK